MLPQQLGNEVSIHGEFASGYLVSSHNEVVWLVSPKGELLWTLR